MSEEFEDETRPWMRLPNEPEAAYAAFEAYRDIGPLRSQRSAYAKWRADLGKAPVGHVTSGTFSAYVKNYDWDGRAEAYDRNNDRVTMLAREAKVRQMAERHAALSEGILKKVYERLKTIDPERLSQKDLIRWFEVAVKVERLSRGEPTEQVRSDTRSIPAFDYSKLTDEEFDQIRNISKRLFESGFREEGVGEEEAPLPS